MASPEEMAQKMISNLKEKTGKDLPAWLKVCKAAKLEKHGQIVKMLKSDHAMTHGFANLVAHMSLKSSAFSQDDGDLVAAQYAGKREGLRPIYDALCKMAAGLGKDVELAPKKAYVSLRRSKQFALIQPSTTSGIDLGLNLKDESVTERLEASGSFNSMVSHRVRITKLSEVDAALKAWMKKAYERA